MFRDFLDSKELTEDDDLPISYNTFRRIFRKFKLSFKRPYTDTCGKCDSFLIIKKYSQNEEEIANAQRLRDSHIQQAEENYACFRFDMNVLPNQKNVAHTIPWRIPPVWTQ